MSRLNTHTRVPSMPTSPFQEPRMPRAADSPAFREAIQAGWAAREVTPRVVPGAAQAARGHRERLSQRWPDRTLVVASGSLRLRTADQAYPFRADSDFAWLTGCVEPDGVLVLLATPGQGHEPILFLSPAWTPADPGFYADALRGAMWVGPGPSLASWASALDIEVRPLHELRRCLDATTRIRFAGDREQIRGLGGEVSDRLRRSLATLRLVKDAWEVEQLRTAVRHTVTGFDAVAEEIPAAVKGLGERWLQGTFDRHARTWGNGPGYQTIVAAGEHAPVLHWIEGTGQLDDRDLLLLDMGVEEPTLYTADVTRTVPTGGEFSAAQRRVYDIVHRAHLAALDACGPGRPFAGYFAAAMEVLVDGLADLGVLRVPAARALRPDGQEHRRYIVCGVGHHLGLDVHDCAQARFEDYQGADLAPGMVFTVEPGLYFHPHDLTLPAELRGIGVRIEDDVLVTDDGIDVLSSELPADADGLEAWVVERRRS